MIPQQPAAHFHSASLYVGDINPDVTEAKLFEIFNHVGPVASIRVCRDAITRRSLGYAYVNFHNVGDAERALDTMNFSDISGRPCRIMWCQRDPSLRKSGVGNVHIRNLAPNITNKDLNDAFSVFGNILSCKVVVDEHGNSKGYGYVHFESQEAADRAIAEATTSGWRLNDQEISISPFIRRQDRTASRKWTNLYVKHFPKNWDEARLNSLFSQFGEITSSKVMRDESDPSAPSKGFGFVNFSSHEAAESAQKAMHGHKIEEGDESVTLYVQRAQKRQERQRELRLRRENIKMERLSKFQGMNLYIKNLDDTIGNEELINLFQPFGTITSACVMRGPDGNSKGFGFVCFSSPEEATKAVSEMNSKIVHNKPLFVTLHQRKDQRREHLQVIMPRMGGPMPRYPMGQGAMYHPMGMYMAPGQPQMQPRQPFMVPHAMIARAPRGGLPAYARGYPMPAYMAPNQQGFKSRGPMQGPQRRTSPGGPRAPNPRGAPAPNQRPTANYKYTNQARNQPGLVAPMPQSPPVHQHMMPPVMAPVAPEPVDHTLLAHADPATQKNMIGERLYPLIHRVKPDLAPKITGMLLEMDNAELLNLLEDQSALNSKVEEALDVLALHARK